MKDKASDELFVIGGKFKSYGQTAKQAEKTALSKIHKGKNTAFEIIPDTSKARRLSPIPRNGRMSSKKGR